MMLRRSLTILAVLISLCPMLAAARPAPRPETGIGLLVVRPAAGDAASVPAPLVIYREPGIGRLGARSPAKMHSLTTVVRTASGEYPLTVTATRLDWLKIVYDDAGREGWIEEQRPWTFARWDDYLRGKAAHLLWGLRKPYYQLRGGPEEGAPERATLTPERQLRIIEVAGDRVRVLVDLTTMGWLRWRDEDGRILLAID